ncbi:Zn-dependent hydrolase [Anaerobacillus alkalilacustris]|uniref:Zn-dependent hydrolase n=1 Tax=Anaerobacillus alkalilacustris TaxID=393763 RepID=UPI000A074BAC|nr:Zn-dependent hydrolase [Anaerobacillus alkalilacustris]
MIATYQINQQRLWSSLQKLATFGASENISEEGITRLSLQKEDLAARKYVIELMKEAGLSVKVDVVGNIIGSLKGVDQTKPIVMTGSHIDTVYQGGRFDGALGVLGAIEAVRSIKESGIKLQNTIEVVSFTDEEGTRFGTGYIGSKAMAGELDETILQLRDDEGVSYEEAFCQAGFQPERYKEAIRNKEAIKAFIEMHIEQGKVLEGNNLAIGIVTSIQGPVWMEVTFEGHADHAGATPMNMRYDSGLAMAEVMLDVEKIATQYGGVGTVGKLRIEPGGVNIIPGISKFSIDLRHIDKTKRIDMVYKVREAIHQVSNKRGVSAKVDVKKSVDPKVCSPKVMEAIEEACHQLDQPTMKLQCGAGHDSLIMANITEMGMIFVRSKDGISHHPKEWTDTEDCAIGTQVLFNTLVNLAQ